LDYGSIIELRSHKLEADEDLHREAKIWVLLISRKRTKIPKILLAVRQIPVRSTIWQSKKEMDFVLLEKVVLKILLTFFAKISDKRCEMLAC
jgi:hypothetical protein